MSPNERDGWVRLHDELRDDAGEALDLPSPELLARYADEPNALSPEDRAIVEDALARSAAVRDELDTLRHFDFSALHEDARAGAGEAKGFLSALVAFLSRPPVVLAGAALAAFLLWWMGSTPPLEPMSEAPEPRIVSPEPRDPAPAPDLAPPGVRGEDGPREEQLAERPPPAADESAPRPGPSESDIAPADAEAPALADREPAPEPATPVPGAEAAAPEMLLAMAMPEYVPAFGTESLDPGAWRLRGDASRGPTIRLVTPDHVVRTRTDRPVLHWSLDRLPERREGAGFFLTLLDGEDEPIALDVPLAWPERAGWQRLELSALDLALPARTRVRWSVAFRATPEAPPTAFDLGWMRWQPLDEVQAAALEDEATPDRVATLAATGCFHEAVARALDAVDRYPDDDRPKEALRLLLAAVGLEALEQADPGASR